MARAMSLASFKGGCGGRVELPGSSSSRTPSLPVTAGVSGELIEARAFDMWAGGESPCIARSLMCHPLPMAVAPWVRKRQGQGQVYTHQGCYTSLSLHPHGDPSWVCPWPDPFF